MRFLRRRIESWVLAIALAIGFTGCTRSLLRAERLWLVWLAVWIVLALMTLVRLERLRVSSIGRAALVLTSGPLTAIGVVALLRSLPDPERFGSLLGVVRELAYSPVFVLPLGFAVSWSVLAVLVREAATPAGRLGWGAAPLMVWALAASRHLHFYVFGWSLHHTPAAVQWEIVWAGGWVAACSLAATVVASLPVLATRDRRKTMLRLETPAVFAVAGVVVEWGLVLTLWRRILDGS